MRAEVEKLINTIIDEADCIDDLIDAMREQRDAMQERDTQAVNALMDETRDISFEVQTHENLRSEFAKKLAAEFSCEPKVSSLISVMADDERNKFKAAADRLAQSVFLLKSELMILNGLIDQNEKYTSMLLSEWRRLNGEGSISDSGGADFRG